jgi:hypothetical protein
MCIIHSYLKKLKKPIYIYTLGANLSSWKDELGKIEQENNETMTPRRQRIPQPQNTTRTRRSKKKDTFTFNFSYYSLIFCYFTGRRRARITTVTNFQFASCWFSSFFPCGHVKLVCLLSFTLRLGSKYNFHVKMSTKSM